jgi:hypothetical protein
MLHKFLIATFATILNNYVTFFRPIDHRTVLTCLVLMTVLWPLIRVGSIRPIKPVLEIASVAITRLFTFGLIVRFIWTRPLFLLFRQRSAATAKPDKRCKMEIWALKFFTAIVRRFQLWRNRHCHRSQSRGVT